MNCDPSAIERERERERERTEYGSCCGYPRYRSLPLSCIERIEVEIDGERVASDALSLSLYGYPQSLTEMRALHDIWWFVLDTAYVVVRTQSPPARGDHQVEVTIQCRIPYSADRQFTQIARCSRRLPLVED